MTYKHCRYLCSKLCPPFIYPPGMIAFIMNNLLSKLLTNSKDKHYLTKDPSSKK